MSEQLNLSSKFFHHPIALSFLFSQQNADGVILNRGFKYRDGCEKLIGGPLMLDSVVSLASLIMYIQLNSVANAPLW